MSGSIWIDISIIVICVLFSGFFSSSEIALETLGEFKVKQLIQVKGKSARALQLYLDNPYKMLNTILLGNTLFNMAAAIFTVDLFIMLMGGYTVYILILSILCSTAVIMLFGEVIPKMIAKSSASAVAVLNMRILTLFFYLMFPLSWVMSKISRYGLKLLGKDIKDLDSFTEDDLALMIEEKGLLEDDKQQMLSNIFDISDIQTKEVMVPRTEMLAVSCYITKDEFISIVNEYGYSRIPVYEGTYDNIKGVLHIKDLLTLDEKWDIKDFIATAREPFFVPETKKIDILLKEFQSSHQQMAIVVDEYGGVSGLITMEDIIEEIIGDIRDEYDEDEGESDIQLVSKNHYRIDAMMNIDDFCDYFVLERTEDMDEYDTVGGLVFDIAKAIPSVGEEFEWRGFKIIINSMINNKIEFIDFILPEKVISE